MDILADLVRFIDAVIKEPVIVTGCSSEACFRAGCPPTACRGAFF